MTKGKRFRRVIKSDVRGDSLLVVNVIVCAVLKWCLETRLTRDQVLIISAPYVLLLPKRCFSGFVEEFTSEIY